nr:MAG TPA: hypothetical protein [Caudoviricetes sp.]
MLSSSSFNSSFNLYSTTSFLIVCNLFLIS